VKTGLKENNSPESTAFGTVVAGFPLWAPLRVAVRLGGALLWVAGCYLASCAAGLLMLTSPEKGGAFRRRVSLAWAGGMRALAGVRVNWVGSPPAKPYFLVTNHLSWQDFFALVCSCDAIIVVQAADETIPVIGRLMKGIRIIPAPLMGQDPARCVADMVRAIQAGESLVMAPEGIVGPGREVRTFHPELLEAAVQTQCPVYYLSFNYRTPPGCPPPSKVALFGPDPYCRDADGRIPASEIEAWGPERPFLPHLLRVLALPWHEITVRFGEAPLTGTDRFTLAQDLQDAVQRIFTPVE
jgi:hypothetical protein